MPGADRFTALLMTESEQPARQRNAATVGWHSPIRTTDSRRFISLRRHSISHSVDSFGSRAKISNLAASRHHWHDDLPPPARMPAN